jgi:hypothetical protein
VNREQAIQEVTKYIDIFHNRQREHSSPGYLSSAAFTPQFFEGLLAIQLTRWIPLFPTDSGG